MPELPRGTVTFAFTDIEGSTTLLKQLGDGYASVLSDHRRLVRDAFTSHDGVEIDTQGDAFFFAFVRARDAVAAAAEVQRAHVTHDWPGGVEVRMRIGLHTGEPTVGEEGYLGLDVVRAARLCGSCGGGHVLLSETTRALVGSALPPGVSVFPLGERHLKDIDEPERVYELEIAGVATGPSPSAARPTPQEPPTAPGTSRADRKARQKEREKDFERRMEEFAERTADGVMGMIERTFSGLGREPRAPRETRVEVTSEQDEEDKRSAVDDIAAKAEELAKHIEAAIAQAQRDAKSPKGE
jgi:class 3 adenylate cyclase